MVVERDESSFKYHSCISELSVTNICSFAVYSPTLSLFPGVSAIMAPSDDSDESDVEDIQTNVLLGLPDGPISSTSELLKPRISRIGGHPVYKFFNLYSLRHLILFSPLRLFLAKVYPSGTPKPPPSVLQCQSCSEPMELLVQLWCPFESSAFDRTLHIWACSRVQCQRREGRCV